MNNNQAVTWVRICLLNLLLVAVWGLLIRYKIAFSLPWADQRNLLHAHSHFAFGGWVTMLLMVLMVRALPKPVPARIMRKFNLLLSASLLCAYGMLITFTLQGYALWSIAFSTASMVLSFLYAAVYFRVVRGTTSFAGSNWFKAALIWNMISALGTCCLSYMMATHTATQHAYLASIYWYLHFQYNGWFFFAAMGLMIHYIAERNIRLQGERFIFRAFLFSCLPAYGLSVLWLHLPWYLVAIAGASALLQVLGWARFAVALWQSRRVIVSGMQRLPVVLLVIVALAFSIKFILQFGSAIPALNTMAFGYRTVVIAYLHLVLLVGISLLLLGLVVAEGLLPVNLVIKAGIAFFATGVLLNELLLGAQGIGALVSFPIPAINELLLAVSVLICVGLGVINLANLRTAKYNLRSIFQ